MEHASEATTHSPPYPRRSFGALGSVAIPGALISAFASWMLWAAIVWVVGVKLFRHSSSYEELLRTLGFVAAPQLLYV